MAKLSCGLSIRGVTEKDGRYYRIVQNKWIGLSRIDEGEDELLRRLHHLEPARPGTYAELIRSYRANGMDELREATRHRYRSSLDALEHHFGRMKLGALKSSHIAVWLETRRKVGKGAIAANRDFAVLSSACNFGMRQGWLEGNPCVGVRRNPERPRKRLVTDAEFLEAFERSPEAFQDLLAVAYLSGARQGDIISWKRSDNLKPQGIEFVQSKTGKPQTIAWSDAMRFFIRRSMARFPGAEHVLCNKFGQPWGTWAIASQMRRLGITWTFRDLRAKAQSDAPHSVLGHGAAMEAVYRKMVRTKPVR